MVLGDGRVVGCRGCSGLAADERTVELSTMAVDPEIRGIRLARQLMQQALAHILALYGQADAIWADVASTSAAASNVFEHFGFWRRGSVAEPRKRPEGVRSLEYHLPLNQLDRTLLGRYGRRPIIRALPAASIDDRRTIFESHALIPGGRTRVTILSVTGTRPLGNHYHPMPDGDETFVVASGAWIFAFEDVQGGSDESGRFEISGPALVYVPSGVSHAFKLTSSDGLIVSLTTWPPTPEYLITHEVL